MHWGYEGNLNQLVIFYLGLFRVVEYRNIWVIRVMGKFRVCKHGGVIRVGPRVVGEI